MTTPARLSLLWIFLFLNFIFCDVFSLMDAALIQEMAQQGTIGGMVLDRQMLLGFAVVMELGMVMVLGSQMLPRPAARWSNVAVGALLILVQTGSLFAGENAPHYWFFSAVEIAALAAIIWLALNWRKTA